MKKILLLTVACLALTVGTALAVGPPGTNLAWTDCTASLAGGLNMTSVCTSNTAAAKNLYGTFVLPPGGAGALNGNDVVLDANTAGSVMPCWWNMTVSPRSAGYGINTTVCGDVGGVGIFDYWSTIAGGPTSGILAKIAGIQCSNCPPNRVRFAMAIAIDATQAQPVPDQTEVYSFTFQLKFGATVGACNGCLTPACFVLNLIRCTQTNLPFIELTTPSDRNFVTWQGGAIDAPGCPLAVPTTNKTWGSVKALYR